MYEKYYKMKEIPFTAYGYCAPGYEQGDYIYGEKREIGLATVERFLEYQEVGFNMVESGTSGTYYGEDWETSVCKRLMDTVYESGIRRYIVGDQIFYEMSGERDGLIGEGKRFDSEQSLDAFVANRMKDYSKHPVFAGVYLRDEPHYYYFKAFGQLYRSIKRVCPKAEIFCNLLPLDTLRWMDERYPQGGDLLERRSKYLNMFLDETGADYIRYDDYPFCYAPENKIYYLLCLQNAAEICRDRKIDFYFVAQSFSMKIGKHDYYWVPNEQELRYQMHILLGFGIKEIGFFTYLPHGNNSTEGFQNDGAMLTREGKRMPLYYDVQKILREAQEILPVVLRFTYRHSAYDVETFCSFLKMLDFAKNERLDNVKCFKTDKEAVLINEMFDEENNQYLYRVINMTDVRCEEMAGQTQNTKICFEEKFRYADVFANGTWTKYDLNGGTLDVALLPGEAAYVLIYQ